MSKKILEYFVLIGIFTVPFIVFIVPNGMYFPFITGKGFAFRVLVEILFGLYVILAVSWSGYRPKFSWITKTILIFTGVILISDLLSVNSYKSLWSNYERMEGFVLIFHLALYYIVVSSVLKTDSLWKKFWNISIVASLIMCMYGVLQLLGKITINQGGVRLDGTFGNASYLAIYLVFHIFLCLYMLSDFKKLKWQKWLYGLTAVFEVLILYFTATRGAILGLIGGLILASLLFIWKGKENIVLRKVSIGFLVTILVLGVAFFSMRNTALVKNSPVLSRFSTLSPAEFKTQGRYYVWPMAIKGFIERPVFGWGQESFNFVFNKYYDPRMYAQEQWFDRTHNIVLDWLVAGGAIGFLAYSSIYVALLYYIWRKKSSLKISQKSIFTGMIAAYIFHNLFVFDNLISYIIFFSLLAYAHSTISSEEHPSHLTKHFSQSAVYGISVVSIAFTVYAIYSINMPAYRANKTLIQAISSREATLTNVLDLFKKIYEHNSFGSSEATEQLIQLTPQVIAAPISQQEKQLFVDFASQKIQEKVKAVPHDARYLLFAGNFFGRIGNYDTAFQHLNSALIESPKKQGIYFEIGSTYLAKGDRVKAFEHFKKAYDLEPSSPESQIIYLIGAVYTNNTQVIKEIVPKIDPKVLIFDDRLLKTYADIGDYNSVIAILTERLTRDPKNAQHKLSLASVYATIGQKQKAIDLIREVIAANPDFKAQGEEYIKQIGG
jgi:tetratricopeptide (TPR) repeat protein/O-antigen ligase